MPNPNPHPIQLVSLRTISAQSGEACDWHSHSFDEFTLVTDDECMIRHPTGWRQTRPNTLLHYRAGEKHGAIASETGRTRFWVIHFVAPGGRRLRSLNAADPVERIWNLDAEQSSAFQWYFLRLLNERTSSRPHAQQAAASWLELLLINVDRWADRSAPKSCPVPGNANPEVLRLWHLVCASIGRPKEELGELYGAANYDSVRHGFRKVFGCSPREMLLRLRMEHAKNLLLESHLSIKEIAWHVGYVQPHDFNRLFHRHTGVAPSQWRSNPTVRHAAEEQPAASPAALLAS